MEEFSIRNIPDNEDINEQNQQQEFQISHQSSIQEEQKEMIKQKEEPSQEFTIRRESFMRRESGLSQMVKNVDNDMIEIEKFFNSERNFIILTNSGKPLFSSQGDIYTLSSIYATLYAIVSKVQTFNFQNINLQDEIVDDDDDIERINLNQVKEKSELIQRNLSVENQDANADSFIDQRNSSVFIRQEQKKQDQEAFNSWKVQNLLPFLSNKNETQNQQKIDLFSQIQKLSLNKNSNLIENLENDKDQQQEENEDLDNPYLMNEASLEKETQNITQEENVPLQADKTEPLKFDQVIEEKNGDNELKAIISLQKKFKMCVMTVGGQGQEGCLIYIAISKCKDESISFLRRQLEYLHLQLISAGTIQIINSLKSNSNYDILSSGNIRDQVESMREYCNFIWKDISAIFNLYPSMRLHPMTRGVINNIILKHKNLESQNENQNANSENGVSIGEVQFQEVQNENEKEEQIYYYGLVIMNTTIVSIFKSDQKIQVAPQDVNIIINYEKITLRNEMINDPNPSTKYFRDICLPGMTEDFHLSVFYKYYEESIDLQKKEQNQIKSSIKNLSGLKIVFVCEEQNEQIEKRLTQMADNIFEDLNKENLIQFLNQSDRSMFKHYQLPDTKCVLIANHSIDQYTHYNMPSPYEKASEEQIKWIRKFESLYSIYQKSKKKRELCIKRVYQMETYLLYSRGDILIFAVIMHKGAMREAIEIGKQILADAKEIESTSFILRHV